ncbi:MAG: hypothetical protein JJE17_00905 [Peptostreptococcaceae bacterium]|nr:hypothetical protein [Peptostreptococcaceae bacterium]
MNSKSRSSDVFKILNMPDDNYRIIYIKTILIILLSTGIEMKNLIYLKGDSIYYDYFGYGFINFYDPIKRRHIYGRVSDECLSAALYLTELTSEFREDAKKNIKDFLFIYRSPKNEAEIKKLDDEIMEDWLKSIFNNEEILFDLQQYSKPYRKSPHIHSDKMQVGSLYYYAD